MPIFNTYNALIYIQGLALHTRPSFTYNLHTRPSFTHKA